jgi:F-type H+-transporting ATPase subunit epsilon
MAETNRIKLEIVTPEKIAYVGEVDSVNAPGMLGEFGVLPQHRPMLSTCRSGVVSIVDGQRSDFFVVGPGFAEVGPDHVVLLTDRCEKGSALDTDVTTREFNEIDAKFKAFSGDTKSSEWEELERDYQWAEAALEASRQAHK